MNDLIDTYYKNIGISGLAYHLFLLGFNVRVGGYVFQGIKNVVQAIIPLCMLVSVV